METWAGIRKRYGIIPPDPLEEPDPPTTIKLLQTLRDHEAEVAKEALEDEKEEKDCAATGAEHGTVVLRSDGKQVPSPMEPLFGVLWRSGYGDTDEVPWDVHEACGEALNRKIAQQEVEYAASRVKLASDVATLLTWCKGFGESWETLVSIFAKKLEMERALLRERGGAAPDEKVDWLRLLAEIGERRRLIQKAFEGLQPRLQKPRTWKDVTEDEGAEYKAVSKVADVFEELQADAETIIDSLPK